MFVSSVLYTDVKDFLLRINTQKWSLEVRAQIHKSDIWISALVKQKKAVLMTFSFLLEGHLSTKTRDG